MNETIQTERLLLRPFEEGDYSLLLKIARDPDTVKYLYYWGLPGVTPEKDASRFLHHALAERQKQPVTLFEYCVLLKETGQPIGEVSAEKYENGDAGIGWILLPEYRGRGYAVEAGRAMMDFSFTHWQETQRAVAYCDTRNGPSRRVMERLGMGLADIEKGARPDKGDGFRGDEATYVLSRVDWVRRKKSGGA